jgi:hypothetical protein
MKTTHKSHVVLRHHSLPTAVTQRTWQKGRSDHKLVTEMLMPENGMRFQVQVFGEKATNFSSLFHFICLLFCVEKFILMLVCLHEV